MNVIEYLLRLWAIQSGLARLDLLYSIGDVRHEECDVRWTDVGGEKNTPLLMADGDDLKGNS